MHGAVSLRDTFIEVGHSLRRPEEVAERWRSADHATLTRFVTVLLLNAAFGLGVYGLTMQMHAGPLAMLRAAMLAPLAAGGAWLIALPSLYIFNNALGSRLSIPATLLAASITVCFGSWAMLASVPVNWFFSLALPIREARLAVNLLVFAGVGVCMTDVFIRLLRALEPERKTVFGYVWLSLLAVIGAELFVLLGVFEF